MKQNLLNKLWLRVWMIVALMTTALAGTAWAADGDTHDFAQDFSQLLNNNASISPISIEAQSYPVKKVVLSYRYNKTITNAVTVEVSVGGNSWGSQYVNGTGQNYSTLEFEGDATAGKIEITFTNNAGNGTGKGTFYVNNVQLIEGGSSGGGGDTPSLEDCDLTLTNAPVALNFDLYNNASAQVINYTTSSTGAVTIADNDYATFDIDEENKTITVTPTAVTPSTQTITVNQAADESYKAGSTTFTLTITDSTPLPAYTVTFGDEGSVTQETPGAEVTLPTRSNIGGYAFAGWSETNVAEETTTAPTIIPAGSYVPTANITLYPVYTKTEGGAGSQNKTASVTISDYASANGWSNGTAYQPLNMDANISVGGVISGNNFKYYTSDSSWRFYTGGSFTVSASSGTITSITFTFASGSMTYNGESVTSNKAVNVNAASAVISVTANTKITAISVNYTISGGGTTYYWSAPVAAAVERPVITAENPFLFSTTATITCETEGAVIKYCFDGENWNDYTEELTITATTTLYAKAVKDENESEVASVTITKNLAVPAVAIDATGITNTNVYEGTAAGSLAASVTYNDEAIEGATVTWSSSNDAVATIDEEGNVTLVAAGTVTFTATYVGTEDYSEKTATYEMTVTNSDPNAPGTENNPYTVAEIIEFIETLNGGTSDEVFVKGIISQIDSYNSKYNSITYWISDDGTTSTQFECYSGLGLNGAAFSSIDDLQIGDEVVVAGTAKKYGDVYEFNYNNYIVSLVRVEKPVAPTFSVAEGTYTEAQSVELSTATEGATIYYTVDGTEPTAESTVYAEAIVVTETTTIKAIAVKDDVASDVATATYTINISTTPSISIAEATIEAPATETFGDVAITYENLTISGEGDFDVQFYDSEGEETEAPDWVLVEVAKDNGDYVVSYMIDANDGEARTAYFKVYAMDGEELVYSNLVTVSQAAYVAPATVDQYALFTGNLVEGDYIIYYNGYAMNTDVENGRLQYAEVTPENDVITTDNAAIVWHIAKSGDYWTIYNAEANAYAASTGVKNKAQMLADGTDDMALWEVSDEYVFVNKKNSEANVNAYLRNNGTYGFACYAATTGGALSLYKKVGDAPVPTSQTVTVSAAGYATMVAAQDLEIPAGVEVFAVEIRGEWAHLEPVTAGVPAGEAVVVKAEAGEYVFNNATDAVSKLTVTNDLVAATAPVTADGSQYVLAKQDEEVGFYKASVGTTIAVGKAYLKITGEAPVKGFTFKFGDDATSINEELRVKSEEPSIYNLAGQRVSKMQRGINIVNGKKLLK